MKVILASLLLFHLEGHISNIHGYVGIRRDWDHKVSKVYYKSPAYNAGILPGDKILSVDGNKKAYADGTAGDEVTIRVLRNGTEKSFTMIRIPWSEIKRLRDEYYLYEVPNEPTDNSHDVSVKNQTIREQSKTDK